MDLNGTDVKRLSLSPEAVDMIVRLCMDMPYRYSAPIIKILGEEKQKQGDTDAQY